MAKRVSIFGCGVQKGGTTSLHAYFCEHPELSAPSRKETHFFDDETRDWSSPDYAKLDAFFSADDGDKRRFDITPIYTFWPPCIARIHAYNPNAKLIFLFRDPGERAVSDWRMETGWGVETLPFAAAIREGRERLQGLAPLDRLRVNFSYLERGLYGAQSRNALAHFPREQILFLRSEDLLRDHRATLGKIAEFLAVSPFPDSGPKREHQRDPLSLETSPTRADRALMREFFAEDLIEFTQLTGLDAAHWLQGEPPREAALPLWKRLLRPSR
jgi:hypothetical protein